MSRDVDVRQEILHKTLQEVAQEDNGDELANPCVICLEAITEPAVTVPCAHANFDFLCIVSWLEQRRNCKSDVHTVKYELENPQGPKLYKLPADPPSAANAPDSTSQHRGLLSRGPRHRRQPAESPRPREPDDPIIRRQYVYRHQLYSLRVGSNRLSQYRELSPESFNRDEELVSRARKWIRRELRVFAFLNPEGEAGPGPSRVARPGQQRLESRRGSNAEFLLEYVIAILRTVDIKGSAGQAEELLRDFLGRDNARLFLHELQAWLRILLEALSLAPPVKTPGPLIGPRLRSTEVHNAHSAAEYQNLIVPEGVNHQVDREMPWRKQDGYNMHGTDIFLTDLRKRLKITYVTE
ncbi:hypothetical protein KXX32_008854 [Aspergillus fumigatus]|nr:hypothetical protein KXX32_008854 [Aspergillus fumigatus]